MNRAEPKCLLVVTGAFHTVGGIAAVNRLVAQAFAVNGRALDIYSLLEADAAVDARHLPPETRVHSRAFAGKKYKFAIAVWWAILHNSYEYVFVDHVNLASLIAPWAWLRRCNYVVWLHGVEVFPPRPDREGRLGLLGARRRLASSEFTRQRIADRFPKLRVEVCEPCLDPVRHAGALSIPSTSAAATVLSAVDGSLAPIGPKMILSVGRMPAGDRFKGQESLIRAFPMINRQYEDAQLVLAGQGEDLPRLKSLAQTYPPSVQARIFFPGFVSNDLLDRLYQNCFVFAMPSIGEGFGLVYLEAMSHGKPCLGARVNRTPCVIRDGETGLLVDDPCSANEVAQKILWLLTHSQQARDMGRSGYELVRSYYLFPNFKERFWQALTN